MRLSDEQVFIVAMVADQSEAFRAAGKIVAEVPSDAAEIDIDVLADEQFGAVLARILRVAGIQMRASVRPEPGPRQDPSLGFGSSQCRADPCPSRKREVRSRVMSWSMNCPR